MIALASMIAKILTVFKLLAIEAGAFTNTFSEPPVKPPIERKRAKTNNIPK